MRSEYGAGQDVVAELDRIIYSDDSADVEAAAQPQQQKKVERFAGIAQRLLRERYVLPTLLQQTSQYSQCKAHVRTPTTHASEHCCSTCCRSPFAAGALCCVRMHR